MTEFPTSYFISGLHWVPRGVKAICISLTSFFSANNSMELQWLCTIADLSASLAQCPLMLFFSGIAFYLNFIIIYQLKGKNQPNCLDRLARLEINLSAREMRHSYTARTAVIKKRPTHKTPTESKNKKPPTQSEARRGNKKQEKENKFRLVGPSN